MHNPDNLFIEESLGKEKYNILYPHFPQHRLLFSHIKEQHKDAVVKEVGVFSLNISK